MKLSRLFPIVCLAACVFIAASNAQIAGVKGTVHRIDGKKSAAAKVTVQPQDTVLIEWGYPVAPPFPKSAKQSSSDEAIVKTTGIHRIVAVPALIGASRIGAVFHAEKVGKTTITLEVNNGKDDIKMTCEVEVKEAK